MTKHEPLTFAAWLGTALILASFSGPSQALAEPLRQTLKYDVPRNFAGKAGKAARDLSGIACAPSAGVRNCLVVNDEGGSAQWATIDGTDFVAGDEMPLVGDDIDDTILGAKPDVDCPDGEGDFGEFDGEAVAFADPYYYIAGSHGCSRHKAQFRPSSFILARVKAIGDADVLTSFRLAEVLHHAERVGAFFGKDLSDNGLNIEGIAIQHGKLIAGLRAPSLDGVAFLVRADLASLFEQGDSVKAPRAETIPIAVPKGAGIRDLTTLPDGRLLILLGPAQEQELPYSLIAVDLAAVVDPNVILQGKKLGELPEVTTGDTAGKAEAIAVLASTADQVELVVLFDGLKNGAPRKYSLAIPR
jgi:hypothetical protein